MQLLFWGKTDKEGRWHPALLHMLDVGLVAEALVHASLNRNALRQVSDWLGVPLAAVPVWVPFVVAAHDLGKISPGFQCKVKDLCAAVEHAGFPFIGSLESDHGLVTRVALGELLREVHLWPALNQSDARALAAAVAAHHGSFHRADETQGYRRKKTLEGKAWDCARRDILCDLAGIFGLNAALSAPSLSEDGRAACLEWLAGFTTLCDWVGSDSEAFTYCDDPKLDLNQYVTYRRATVHNAIRTRGLDSAGFVSRAPRSFGAMFPKTPEPREAQRRVLELGSEPGVELVVLEAATGSGKTEAALALAEQWGATNQKQGVYVALPTMATSNSLFTRIEDWLKGMHGPRIEFHLLHGHALLNPDYEALLNETRLASISEGREARGGEVAASSWFTGRKRGLLAPFAVGTVDQALLAVLDSRHQFLRLYGLACKVLVLDEIHAYDTYTSTLIERLLAWARAMACRVILLSATLPGTKLRSLVSAWRGGGTALPAELPPLPRVTVVKEHGVEVTPLPKAGSTRPAVAILLVAPDLADIADTVVQVLQGRGCAACICNTVGRAQELYATLKSRLGGQHVTLIHARMPLGERLRREERILTDFGREAQVRPELHAVIGTQVLEQSLDVDFDLMFSELAPVDLILQRIGRLHRHKGTDRPVHLGRPCLLLEIPISANGRPTFRRTDKFVYSEAVLLRSWFALRNLSRIESDHVDHLIFQVYDRQPESITEQELRWVIDADETERTQNAKEENEAHARMIASPYSESFPDAPRSSAGILEEDDPQVHRSLQALTRLGPPAISLVCLHRQGDSVFLHPDGRVPIDLHLVPSPVMRRSLVQASISVSNHRVYAHFSGETPPPAWRKDPVLRHMRNVMLENGGFEGRGFTLNLDPELGLLIQGESDKED